ncbi:MAG: DUF2459 domain-containing protein [Burkholderiales bacterium]
MARRGWILAPILALTACAAPPAARVPSVAAGPAIAIYLVAHDDHTGIAIRRAGIPAGLWPESRDFPQAEFLEVGWGARDYYMGRDQGFWGTLKAAVGHTQSVLHVAGFRGSPADTFRGSEVIELSIPRDGFERLVRYIHDAHERAGAGAVAPLRPGLYGDSRFYPAWEQFNLLNTCNVWTARALRSAGLPIEDAITKEGVMSQVRALAQRPGA